VDDVESLALLWKEEETGQREGRREGKLNQSACPAIVVEGISRNDEWR